MLKNYSKEELANFITHAIGFILALAGLVVLIRVVYHDPDFWRQFSFVLYGTTVVMLFGASTLYHGVTKPSLKRILRVVDHMAIYLLIAGTYTPFMVLPLRGSWGWWLLGIIWSLALFGIVFKLWYTGKLNSLSTGIYLGMGWLAIVAIEPMMHSVPPASLGWLITGGLLYTLGVVFYNWKSLPYHHAIWHLFVLAGSGCHYISIIFYL